MSEPDLEAGETQMRVFISWSGSRSKQLALHLYEWLGAVVQRAEPWMSERDLEAGERWNEELSARLKDTHFGVICLTRENLAAPWLLFEAGALAKAVDSARVVPVLLDLARSDLTFPLAQFQAVDSDEAGMRSLAAAVNSALGENRLSAARLDNLLTSLWPGLATSIESIPKHSSVGGVHRSDRQLLEEVVEGMHQVQRSLPATRGALSEDDESETRWEDYYLRGVNLANRRGDTSVDVAALRAYTNAIALVPGSLPDNLRSRLYAYRGAIYKRLNRLEEAEQDLVLAQRWATEKLEIEDALYNMACVLAMGPNPQSALPLLDRLISHDGAWAQIVRSKPYYFRNVLDDPEFKKLIMGNNHPEDLVEPN
jgi:tetratricopeptide (TPR) repeat protein